MGDPGNRTRRPANLSGQPLDVGRGKPRHDRRVRSPQQSDRTERALARFLPQKRIADTATADAMAVYLPSANKRSLIHVEHHRR